MTAVTAAPSALVFVAIIVFYIAAYWQLFAKAGQPGWGAIVPIFNMYLYCKIAGRPGWWLLLFFIPLVNVLISLLLAIDIAKAFAKSSGFGVGIWLLSFIFVPILGFGSATYTAPSGGPRAAFV